MIRHDNAYWQRLRKDKRSAAAVLLAAVAGLATTLAVIDLSVSGTHYQMRANPLYWLLMLPMVWWITGLVTYAPRYMRLFKPGLALACIASLLAALLAFQATGTWTGQTIACAVTLIAAAASLAAYRGSLVDREGPAR